MNSLFGLSSPLITELYGNISLHQDVVADFKDLQKKASKFNIELEIISGYRSFSRQKIIWNRNINDSPSLNDILKRLRWSAFPGLSRHHWGSDFDVVDNIPLKKNSDYNVSLEPFEYSSKGIFSKLGQFLDESLQDIFNRKSARIFMVLKLFKKISKLFLSALLLILQSFLRIIAKSNSIKPILRCSHKFSLFKVHEPYF